MTLITLLETRMFILKKTRHMLSWWSGMVCEVSCPSCYTICIFLINCPKIAFKNQGKTTMNACSVKVVIWRARGKRARCTSLEFFVHYVTNFLSRNFPTKNNSDFQWCVSLTMHFFLQKGKFVGAFSQLILRCCMKT